MWLLVIRTSRLLKSSFSFINLKDGNDLLNFGCVTAVELTTDRHCTFYAVGRSKSFDFKMGYIVDTIQVLD